MDNSEAKQEVGLAPYLSPLNVWALSFGCAVGWGAFVMPGTTFLPAAGPLGSAIGLLIGGIIMFLIGANYWYLMNKFKKAGGTLTYAIETFGYDHGFLCSWFLILVYVAVIWANATALSLICRYLLGDTLQIGLHYTVLEYDVYLGEILVPVLALLLVGSACIWSKKLSVALQSVFAIVLFLGIVVCFFAVINGRLSENTFTPVFANTGMPPIRQVSTIVALSPWAFVGFESISNSVEGFNFPVKKSIYIFAAALLCGTLSYILLTLLAVAVLPEGYPGWVFYIAHLPNRTGIQGLPTFHAVYKVMGNTGLFLLGLAAFGAMLTGLIGNFIAASRLLYAMSKEGILPPRFGTLKRGGTPKIAILFLMAVSVFIPFLGRTAIGWIVDVNTVGAAIAYGYTSAAALMNAKKDGNKRIQMTGLLGLCASALFFLYFMSWSSGAMSTESYIILALWGLLGFIYFRIIFGKDEKRRFGKSTFVWIGFLFLIFFTSLMWISKSTSVMSRETIQNIRNYYEEKNPNLDRHIQAETEKYFSQEVERSVAIQTRNSLLQMLLIMLSLGILFSIYSLISKRERRLQIEKYEAEESNKAKTIFLSNMSHDIRTPMNAIIGYIHLAEQDKNDPEKMSAYLGKIKASSQHLLALINDVLEMSRIESGKMELEPLPVDLKQVLSEVEDMFSTQMSEKDIEFVVDSSQVKNTYVLCDKNRLNRVLLNLLSNAYKFTPEGGTVSLTLWEIHNEDAEIGSYELRVSDSGIGMTKEFASKVFEAFERERTSTVSGIQGTGLGMAITKKIIDSMGGTIEVITSPGCGTEFVIRLRFPLQDKNAIAENETYNLSRNNSITTTAKNDASKADTAFEASDTKTDATPHEKRDFKGLRLLLTDDIEMNREIAAFILTNLGFEVDTAFNGKEAVEKVAVSEPGHYAAVLMDIQMPVMDGYEATSEIRSLKDPMLSKIPIIAMTANAFSEDVQKAREMGMNAHVAKPIDINDLRNKLEELI